MEELVYISFDIKTDLKEKLEKEAKNQKRSLDSLVKEILEDYIAEKEYKKQAINEGLIKEDSIFFVPKENLRYWFNSLGEKNELPIPKPDMILSKKEYNSLYNNFYSTQK